MAWNISKASLEQTVDTAPRNSIFGMFIGNSGAKLYIIDVTGGADNVAEYNLLTPWDISTLTYVQSFSTTADESVPFGATFKNDGTTMYIVGMGSSKIHEYALSPAWDISSATLTHSTAFLGGMYGIHIIDDGTKIYVTRFDAKVYEYTLSTAWDISTISKTNEFSTAAEDNFAPGIILRADGLKMYLAGHNSDAAYEYNLSTAWDITTATYLRNLSINDVAGIFVNDTGNRMYTSLNAHTINMHEMPTSKRRVRIS